MSAKEWSIGDAGSEGIDPTDTIGGGSSNIGGQWGVKPGTIGGVETI